MSQAYNYHGPIEAMPQAGSLSVTLFLAPSRVDIILLTSYKCKLYLSYLQHCDIPALLHQHPYEAKFYFLSSQNTQTLFH